MPEVLIESLPEVLTQINEEQQVILHCSFLSFPGALIRIWPCTFLIPKNGGDKIPLVHAENISFAPVWTQLEGYGVFTFTLIFNGLPRNCSLFDMVEDINEPGSFIIPDIERNSTDVYRVWI